MPPTHLTSFRASVINKLLRDLRLLYREGLKVLHCFRKVDLEHPSGVKEVLNTVFFGRPDFFI